MNEQMQPFPPYSPPPKLVFPMGKRELWMALGVLAFSLLLCNCLLFAGTNLGFAVAVIGVMACTVGYLYSRGHRLDWYSGALLILCLAIIAAFARSDDSVLKFLMVCVLLVVPSLSYCLMAGQNHRDPGGITSLLDALQTLFALGIGRIAESGRGIREACRSTGTVGKKGGAVALGLLIAVPVVAVLVPLLMSADAAFEGLLDLLPEFEWSEMLVTAIFGTCTGYVFYTRAAALHHLPKTQAGPGRRSGLGALTVNTVLIAAVFVYAVYLLSQLAYVVGGFAGILPAGYTMAEYARRGFFEMGWLCAINLTLMALAVGLVSAKGKTPLSTKLLCLFLGLVTLFLVAAASAKMLLYIRSYGLTRLRVLTEVFMVWLALTTVFVCLWLFRPKIPYMKYTMVAGLALCAALMWADVDTQVARYNVRAYQMGQLETVDVDYLYSLNSGAVPYIGELAHDSNPAVAREARHLLESWWHEDSDLRDWNWAKAQAGEILKEYQPKERAEVAER